MTQKPRTADVEASVKIGKLSLIDLAGSERAAVSEVPVVATESNIG